MFILSIEFFAGFVLGIGATLILLRFLPKKVLMHKGLRQNLNKETDSPKTESAPIRASLSRDLQNRLKLEEIFEKVPRNDKGNQAIFSFSPEFLPEQEKCDFLMEILEWIEAEIVKDPPTAKDYHENYQFDGQGFFMAWVSRHNQGYIFCSQNLHGALFEVAVADPSLGQRYVEDIGVQVQSKIRTVFRAEIDKHDLPVIHEKVAEMLARLRSQLAN